MEMREIGRSVPLPTSWSRGFSIDGHQYSRDNIGKLATISGIAQLTAETPGAEIMFISSSLVRVTGDARASHGADTRLYIYCFISNTLQSSSREMWEILNSEREVGMVITSNRSSQTTMTIGHIERVIFVALVLTVSVLNIIKHNIL